MKKVKIFFLILICCFYSALCCKPNIIKPNAEDDKKILNQKNDKKLKNIYVYLQTFPTSTTLDFSFIGFEFLYKKTSFFIEMGFWYMAPYFFVSYPVPKISIGAKYYLFQLWILNPFIGGGYTGMLDIINVSEKKYKYFNALNLKVGNRFNFGLLNLHVGLTTYLIGYYIDLPLLSSYPAAAIDINIDIDLNLAIGLRF